MNKEIVARMASMNALHEFVHSRETVRHYNKVVVLGDGCLALLKDEDINGNPLDKTLENLKTDIHGNCQSILTTSTNIQAFLNGHDAYDLSAYTDRTQAEILAEKPSVDSFASNLEVAIEEPQIDSVVKLGQITASNPIDYAVPVKREESYHHAIILNDWLDASSYTLQNIDHRTGGAISLTKEQQKIQAWGMLNQFENLTTSYPSEIQSYVNKMWAVRNYVLGELGTANLLDLAQYIDNNIPKLPLMRRLWAIG